MGSIGGAGPLDMVFLSGMLALGLSLIFIKAADKRKTRSFGWPRLSYMKRDELLEMTDAALANKKYTEAVKLGMEAVDISVSELSRRTGSKAQAQELMNIAGIHPYKVFDYTLLKAQAQVSEIPEADAVRAVTTAKYLSAEIVNAQRKLLASTGQRFAAFLIDLLLLLAIIVPMGFYVLSKYPLTLTSGNILTISPVILAMFFWALASQMVYFTICEWLWGRSLGKKLIGIIVVSEEQTKIGFIHSFTRNVFRMVDITLFAPITLIMVALSRKKQRVGDFMASTTVIRLKPA